MAGRPEAELTVTHRSTVTPDQIDHLGHMNVHHYAINAEAGTAALVAGFELPSAIRLRLVDVYTRHFREQLEGARLTVRSGVLGSTDRRVRLYHELVDEETEELAASFVHGVDARTAAGTSADLPEALVETLRARAVEIPARGAPRSLDIAADLRAAAPDLETVRERGLAMRHPRRVMADECDDTGVVPIRNAPMLTWGGIPVDGTQAGPILVDGPNGERMGWAAMETRALLDRDLPAGTRLQAFAATGHLTDKISHRMQWAYDLDTGELVAAHDVISLAFDTVSRRPMAMPPHVRAHEERIHHPDLRPRA